MRQATKRESNPLLPEITLDRCSIESVLDRLFPTDSGGVGAKSERVLAQAILTAMAVRPDVLNCSWTTFLQYVQMAASQSSATMAAIDQNFQLTGGRAEELWREFKDLGKGCPRHCAAIGLARRVRDLAMESKR